MHEVGVASSILSTVLDIAKQNNATKITRVGIKLGALSGVEQHSMKFAFDAMKADTLAADAEMLIEYVSAVGFCSECGRESTPNTFYSLCSHCGSPALEITAGQEFNISYIDVD
jgi:hydrogenase nickel incorporation protein HypA/HybF